MTSSFLEDQFVTLTELNTAYGAGGLAEATSSPNWTFPTSLS